MGDFFFCGDFTNSERPDILLTWYLYGGGTAAPRPSGATSPLCDPVSVSIPSAPGERTLQTPVHDEQSQRPVRLEPEDVRAEGKSLPSRAGSASQEAQQIIRIWSVAKQLAGQRGHQPLNPRALASAVLCHTAEGGGQGPARDERRGGRTETVAPAETPDRGSCPGVETSWGRPSSPVEDSLQDHPCRGARRGPSWRGANRSARFFTRNDSPSKGHSDYVEFSAIFFFSFPLSLNQTDLESGR